MTDSLRIKCELLAENRKILKKYFRSKNAYLLQVAASIYASSNALADPQKIKNTMELIKANTRSATRIAPSMTLVLASIFSLELDPKAELLKTIDRYAELKRCLSNSKNLPYAAYLLSKHGENIPTETIKKYCIAIKSARSFLHVGNDAVLATLYALFEKKPQYAASDIKAYTVELSKYMPKRSASTVAEMFVFGEHRGYVKRYNNIISFLNEDKCKVGHGYGSALIAPLALLDNNEEELSDKIVEIYDHIEKNPDFSQSIKGKQRIMYAALYLYRELIKKSDDKALILADDAAFSIALAVALKKVHL